jgi:hypothetical protein
MGIATPGTQESLQLVNFRPPDSGTALNGNPPSPRTESLQAMQITREKPSGNCPSPIQGFLQRAPFIQMTALPQTLVTWEQHGNPSESIDTHPQQFVSRGTGGRIHALEGGGERERERERKRRQKGRETKIRCVCVCVCVWRARGVRVTCTWRVRA